jgi:hypothetical protein
VPLTRTQLDVPLVTEAALRDVRTGRGCSLRKRSTGRVSRNSAFSVVVQFTVSSGKRLWTPEKLAIGSHAWQSFKRSKGVFKIGHRAEPRGVVLLVVRGGWLLERDEQRAEPRGVTGC